MPELGSAVFRIRTDAKDFYDDLERARKRSRRATDDISEGFDDVKDSAEGAGDGVSDFDKKTRRSTRTTRQADSAVRDLHRSYSGLGGLMSQFRGENDRTAGSLRKTGGAMSAFNNIAMFTRNILRTIKPIALVAGLGLLAQSAAAAGAGFYAMASAMAPAMGLLAAMPQGIFAVVSAFASVKAAFGGVGDAISAGLKQQAGAGAAAAASADKQQEALGRVADAEENLADAQDQAQDAQEALSQAREDATRELEDMRLAAQRASLSEKQARMELTAARKELNKVRGDATSTSTEIKEAELRLRDAQLGVKESTLDNARAHEDLNEAEKGGIEQMPTMVQAHEQLESAQDAVADAAEALADAQHNVTQEMGAGGGAADAFAQKMAELSPAARDFVRFIIGLKPKIDELQAAAAEGLFPGLEKGITSALNNFGPLKNLISATSKVIGDFAAKFGQLLGTDAFGKGLTEVTKTNTFVLKNLGDTIINLAKYIGDLMIVAQPMVRWLSRVIKRWSEARAETMEAGRATGRTASFFDRTRKVLTIFSDTMGNLWRAMKGLAKAATPLGMAIGKAFEHVTQKWADWTESTKGQNRLKEYFDNIKPALFEFGRLLGDVVKMFFKLGEDAHLKPLLHQIRKDLLPAVESLLSTTTKTFGPSLIDAITNVVRLFEQLAGVAGPIKIMVDTIGFLAGGLADLMDQNSAVKTFVSTIITGFAVIKTAKFAGAITGLSGIVSGLKDVAKGAKAAKTAAAGTAAVSAGTNTLSMAGGAAAGAGATKDSLMGKMGGALTAMPPQAKIAAAAIVAIGAAFVIAYKKSETFRKIVDAVVGWVKDAAQDVARWIKKAFENSVKWVSQAIEDIVDEVKSWKVVWFIVETYIDLVTGYIKLAVKVWTTYFKIVWKLIGPGFKAAWTIFSSVASKAIDAIGTIIGGLIDIISGVIKVIGGIFKGDFGQMWEGVKKIFGGGVKTVIGIFKGITAPVRGTLEGMVKIWKSILSKIGGILGSFKSKITGVWSSIKSGAQGAWQKIKDFIINPVKSAAEWVSSRISNLREGIAGAWDRMKTAAGTFASTIKTKVEGAFKGVANAVIRFVKAIGSVIDKIPGVGDPTAGINYLARGGKVTRPTAIVGEEAPQHPEFVIATNPAYRKRNQQFLAMAAKELGMPIPGYATGGHLGPRPTSAENKTLPKFGIGVPDIPSPGDVVNAGKNLAKSAFKKLKEAAMWALDHLPDPGDYLPDWIMGMGWDVLDDVKDWIGDKVGLARGGVLGADGQPMAPGFVGGTTSRNKKNKKKRKKTPIPQIPMETMMDWATSTLGSIGNLHLNAQGQPVSSVIGQKAIGSAVGFLSGRKASLTKSIGARTDRAADQRARISTLEGKKKLTKKDRKELIGLKKDLGKNQGKIAKLSEELGTVNSGLQGYGDAVKAAAEAAAQMKEDTLQAAVAQASLTTTLDDDLTAANAILAERKKNYDAAVASGNPAFIASAAESYQSAKSDVQAIKDAQAEEAKARVQGALDLKTASARRTAALDDDLAAANAVVAQRKKDLADARAAGKSDAELADLTNALADAEEAVKSVDEAMKEMARVARYASAEQKSAQAALTGVLSDDVSAMQELTNLRKADYEEALKSGDKAAITETAGAYADALSSLQSIRDQSREDKIRLQAARASLTKTLTDDVAAAEALKVLREQQLAEAEASGDEGRIADAIGALSQATDDLANLSGSGSGLASVIQFGNRLPENILRGILGEESTGSVEVNQYFTQPPTDPYTWLRSSDFAARAVFG